MKRSDLRRLSLLAAFMVLATAPQLMPPAVEAEKLVIPIGRGKGIEVK